AKYRQNAAPMQQLNTRTVSPQSYGSIRVDWCPIRRGLRLGTRSGPQPVEREPHGHEGLLLDRYGFDRERGCAVPEMQISWLLRAKFERASRRGDLQNPR